MSLTYLTDTKILELMQDRAVVGQFECLRNARMRQARPQGCRRCGGNAKSTGPDYNALKLCLVNSGAEKRRWLMKHIGAQKIRVEYTTETGKKTTLTVG